MIAGSRDFLSEILARKRAEVAEHQARTPADVLRAACEEAPRARSLFDALSAQDGPVRVIAELKRASPSAGAIARFAAPERARLYASGGAAALSVLTDGPGFGGSLSDLQAARGAVELPLLRKDFLVDPYQLLEARAAGADAVLLIVAALDAGRLATLLAGGAALGMEALVEVHDARELAVALDAGARLVGINHRNLTTFEVDLAVSEALLPRIPPGVKVVAESGIRGRADVERLQRAGVSNFLVGELLARAAAPARALQELGATRA